MGISTHRNQVRTVVLNSGNCTSTTFSRKKNALSNSYRAPLKCPAVIMKLKNRTIARVEITDIPRTTSCRRKRAAQMSVPNMPTSITTNDKIVALKIKTKSFRDISITYIELTLPQ